MNTPFNGIPNLPNIETIQQPEAKKKQDKKRKPRAPRDKEKCETKPVFVRKLLEIYNNYAEVARIVGCSDPVIHKGLKNESITKAYEFSAQRFYMLELEKQASKQVTFTAKVSQEVWEALQPWLQQANADYKAFTS